jgi:hypothetical protein
MILYRVVENNEPLRTVAHAYGISHETTHRIMLSVEKQHGEEEP